MLALTALVVAGIALIATIVVLLQGSQRIPARHAPLVSPAPAVAAGLPRYYRTVRNAGVRAAVADFRLRFSGALTHGSAGRYPAGFYREPGTVDAVASSTGWMMYLGYNSPTSLGTPSATARVLIGRLAQRQNRPWRVAPGRRGGAAWCVVTVIDRTPMAVCDWATEHTAGAIMSPTRDTTPSELAVLMPQMRRSFQPG